MWFSSSDFLVNLLEDTSCESFDEFLDETLSKYLHESLHKFLHKSLDIYPNDSSYVITASSYMINKKNCIMN